VIDCHSVMVANLGLGDVPLLGAVIDCSLEATPPNLTKVSSDPDIDPKEEPFIQVGTRDSLPQSHGCPVVTASPSRRKFSLVLALRSVPAFSTRSTVTSTLTVSWRLALSVSRLSSSAHATKIYLASRLVLALELRERHTNCQGETQDCLDKYHRNEPVSQRHPTAFANAVVSAAVSFQLPRPGRAGPSTAPMEASDAPGLVQSANITTDDSVEPAETTVAAPAPSARPEAPLAATAQ
jgi:hypothetical protein